VESNISRAVTERNCGELNREELWNQTSHAQSLREIVEESNISRAVTERNCGREIVGLVGESLREIVEEIVGGGGIVGEIVGNCGGGAVRLLLQGEFV